MLGLQHRGGAQKSLGRDPHQPVGDQLDALLEPRLAGLPRAATQLVEKSFLVAVAAEQLDILDRQIQPVATGIFQRHAIMGHAKRLDGFKPGIAADAMFDMDDQIARRQRGGVAQEILGLAAAFRPPDQPVAQHILFRDDGQPPGRLPVRGKALVQRPDRQPQRAGLVGQIAQVSDGLGARDPLIGDQPGQTFARAFGKAGDHHPAVAQNFPKISSQRFEKVPIFCLPFGREIAADAPARIQNARTGRLRQNRQPQQPVRGKPARPFQLVGEHLARGDRTIDGVGAALALQRLAPGIELFADGVPAGIADLIQMIVQHHRSLGQIGKQAFQPGMEPRQPMLHPRHLATSADAFVKRVIGAAAIFGAVVLAKPGDRSLVQNDLGHGRQLDMIELFDGTLCFCVKSSRAIQNVAEHVQTDRAGIAGGIDVDDAAPDGEIARLGHGRRLREPHAGQKGAQGPLVHAAADAGRKACVPQRLARGDALHGGAERGQQDERTLDRAMRQCGQHRHAHGHDRGRRRDPVIGRRVPCRELQHHGCGGKEFQRGAHRRHAAVVAGDMDDRLATRQFARDQSRVHALGRAGKDQVFGMC